MIERIKAFIKRYQLMCVFGLGLAALLSVMTVYAAFSGEFDRIRPELDYSAYYYGADEHNTESDHVTAADAAVRTVCINTATADELAAVLPGIGPSKAKAIVEYREAIGRFNSVEELLEVKGIGEKTLEAIRPYCTLE